MLKNEIINILKDPKIENDAELKLYAKRVQKLIGEYEESIYENYTEEKRREVKSYRKRLGQIIDSFKLKFREEGSVLDKHEGVEALKLLNSQISMGEVNRRLLEKGTLKLVGLNYTNKEIDKAIDDASIKFERTRNIEKSEIRKIKIAFYFLILIIILIILDKIYLKFKMFGFIKEYSKGVL